VPPVACLWRSNLGRQCGRLARGEREYCLFHLAEKTPEEAREFGEAFEEEIDRQQRQHPDLLDFEGFHFPDAIVIRDMLPATKEGELTQISQKINFRAASFEGWFIGTGIVFQATADFSDAEFRHNAEFDNATFKLGANFSTTRFHAYTSFSQVTFQGSAEFSSTVFLSAAYFDGTRFEGRASFDGAEFKEGVDFKSALLEDHVDFTRTNLLGWTKFDNAVFKKSTRFMGARFESTDFGHVSFGGIAEFNTAVFQDVRFRETRFQQTAVFHAATFGRAKFDGATFEEMAIFTDTVFQHDTYFGGTTFRRLTISPIPQEREESAVVVSGSVFLGTAELDWSGFLKPQSKRSTLLCLWGCTFDVQGRANLKGAMGCVSLLGTDLSKITFSEEDWSERPDLTGRLKAKKRRTVLEERMLEVMAKNPKDVPALFGSVNADAVAQVYRMLRDNYEANRRYAEAGDFFVGEMEILRQYKTVQMGVRRDDVMKALSEDRLPLSYVPTRRSLLDPYRILLLEPYRILALYGESIRNPFLTSISVILVFTALRVVVPAVLSPSPVTYLSSRWAHGTADILWAVSRIYAHFESSLLTFFQLRGNTSLDLWERLISAPILGLLFVALRRKLERR
jgi:uncharacterized protein YjbI with pentapeptide repeats